jgi:hypothetical protein
MSKIKVNTIAPRSGTTVTLGEAGDTIALGACASQTGFGRTGTVDWCSTVKTSPLTAVSGKGYFINTCGGAITVTLPSSPSAGDIVSLKDYKNTWAVACKSVTLGRGGSKISGECEDGNLATEGQSVTMIYVDGTQGWENIQTDTTVSGNTFITATGGTIVTCGNYKTHIFTADGCFSVSAGFGPNSVADYVVVAGGGGGGVECASSTSSGAGGAGGFRLSNSPTSCIAAPVMSPLAAGSALAISPGTYPITVGGGGPGSTFPAGAPARMGTPGVDSVFDSITSAGGGGGSGNGPAALSGLKGGSGGGGKQDNGCGGTTSPCGSISGGDGNEPPVAPPQGNDGGHSDAGPLSPGPAGTYAAGGGGGAGAVGKPGGPPSYSPQGCGGIGSFVGDGYFGPAAPTYGTPGPVGSTRYFAGGGGGGGTGGSPSPRPYAVGGAGGGGDGGAPPGTPNPNTAATVGTANTGGGGGGAGNYGPSNCAPAAVKSGANGGPGIVAIRYKFQ